MSVVARAVMRRCSFYGHRLIYPIAATRKLNSGWVCYHSQSRWQRLSLTGRDISKPEGLEIEITQFQKRKRMAAPGFAVWNATISPSSNTVATLQAIGQGLDAVVLAPRRSFAAPADTTTA